MTSSYDHHLTPPPVTGPPGYSKHDVVRHTTASIIAPSGSSTDAEEQTTQTTQSSSNNEVAGGTNLGKSGDADTGQQQFVPHICEEFGKYRDRCSINSNCPGNLTDIQGNCYYTEKCNFFRPSKEEGCECWLSGSYFKCEYAIEAVQNLSADELEHHARFTWTHSEDVSASHSKQFEIDFFEGNNYTGETTWSHFHLATNNTHYYEEKKQQTDYIICVYVTDRQEPPVRPNPSCTFIRINKKCIDGKIKDLSIKNRMASWSLTNPQKSNAELVYYNVTQYVDASASCGGGAVLEKTTNFEQENTISILQNLPPANWTVCVKPVKKNQFDECDHKSQCVSEYIEGYYYPLKVQNFTLIEEQEALTVSWSPRTSWNDYCKLEKYELSLVNPGHNEALHYYPCFHKSCQYTFPNLLPDVNYTVKITPLFVGGIRGIEDILFGRPKPICPKQVTNLDIRLYEDHQFRVLWSGHGSSEYYEVEYYKKAPCQAHYSLHNEDSHVYNNIFKANEEAPYYDVKFCVKARKLFDHYCSINIKQCKEENARIPMTLRVESLAVVNVTETTAQISWIFPPSWNDICTVAKTQVTIRPGNLQQDVRCPQSKCSMKVTNLMSSTTYSFTVKVTFSSGIEGQDDSVTLTTLEKFPVIPEEKIFTFDTNDLENFVTYNIKGVQFPNGNCTIKITDVTSKEALSVSCADDGTAIKNSELELGRHYEVAMEVCNSRACVFSATEEGFTPPKVPERRHFNVTLVASNSTTISLQLPKANDDFQGFIYIVVASDPGHQYSKEESLDFVRRKIEATLHEAVNRFRRSATSQTSDEKLSLADVVPMHTSRCTIQKDSLNLQAEDNGIYVSPVMEYKSGGYSQLVGSEFFGPFRFENYTATNKAITWTIAVVAAVLISIVIALIVLSRRRRMNPIRFGLSVFQANFPGGKSSCPGVTYSSSQANQILDTESEKHILVTHPQQKDVRKAGRNTVSVPVPSVKTQLCQPDISEETEDEDIYTDNDIYVNTCPKIYLDELEHYLIPMAHSLKLEEEYKSVPGFIPGKSIMEGKKSANRLKNRYQNNPPYDDTRVVLPRLPNDPSSDYINANSIDVVVDDSGALAKYIATQGPMSKKSDTIYDFWRMIWSEKVEAIIMVTNLYENGRLKCEKYWPDTEDVLNMDNDIVVTMDEHEENKVSFIIRRFSVIRKDESRKVTQYHFVEWPDHGVPLVATPLGEMVKIIRANHRYGPTVVHCSAGIGRTGTILLVILCLEELELLKCVDIRHCLLRLRNCRPKLIQNFNQYQFAHLLLWVILFEHKTSILNPDFISAWQSIHSNPEDQSYNTALHFSKLKSFTHELTFAVARKSNIHKKLNRYANILPADSRRVTLNGIAGYQADQYINAVRVDGFNCKDAYIVAEHPLPNTLDRIWLMILERQIPVWTLLNELPDNQNFPPVLPDELSTVNLGHVTIDLMCTTFYEHFKMSNVRIQSNLECYANVVFDTKVIQLIGWTGGSATPASGPDILISLLDNIERMGPFRSPVLYSCVDGLTACGLTLALDITRLRAQSLQEVNIFSACVAISYDRPEFIVSLEQYHFLHEAMSVYFLMQNEDTYCDTDEPF